MKDSDGDSVVSEKAPEPVGSFPHARRAGPFLFLSGIGPRVRGEENVPGTTIDNEGNVIRYDFGSQCHQVFQNVRDVLDGAGLAWNDIVDVTVFLTDMKRDFERFNRLYGEYFAENQPTRTTIEVGRLPTPIAIELKVIALVPNH